MASDLPTLEGIMESLAAVLVWFDGAPSAVVPRQVSLGLFEAYAGGMRYAYDNFGPIISGKVAWVLFSDGTCRAAGEQLKRPLTI
jgi:hypothetical protein